MYENLGTQWASSVPAFLGLVCAPLPFLFYRWGKRLRERSKYASEAKRIMGDMMKRHVDTDSVEINGAVVGMGLVEKSSDQEEHGEA